MKGHLAAGGVIALGLLAWLMRPASVTAPGTPAEATRSSAPEAPAPPSPRPVPALLRDPFRYAEPPPLPRAAPAAVSAPLEPVLLLPTPAPPEPVKLLGFVWRNGSLRAVLAVRGTTVVAGVGETAEGYALLSVSEDAGVRLRGPGGEELHLRPQR